MGDLIRTAAEGGGSRAAAAFARLSEQVASPAAASELCGVPGALGAICAAADAGGRAGAAALLLLARVASCGDADVAQALATHPAGCLPTLVDAGRGGGACGAAARRALLDILMADLSLSLAVRSTRGAVEAIADAIARDCCDSAVGLLFTITSGARSDLLRRLARIPGCLDALFFRIEPGGYEALSPLSALWQMVDSDVCRNGALLRDAPGSLEAIAAAAARGVVAWGLALVLLAALPCASEAERAALAKRAGRVDGFVAAALRRLRRHDEAGAAAAAVLLTMARGDASFAALICGSSGSTCDICAAAVGGGERGGAAIQLLSTLCASCPDLEVSLARAMLETDGFMTALVRAVRAGDADACEAAVSLCRFLHACPLDTAKAFHEVDVTGALAAAVARGDEGCGAAAAAAAAALLRGAARGLELCDAAAAAPGFAAALVRRLRPGGAPSAAADACALLAKISYSPDFAGDILPCCGDPDVLSVLAGMIEGGGPPAGDALTVLHYACCHNGPAAAEPLLDSPAGRAALVAPLVRAGGEGRDELSQNAAMTVWMLCDRWPQLHCVFERWVGLMSALLEPIKRGCADVTDMGDGIIARTGSTHDASEAARDAVQAIAHGSAAAAARIMSTWRALAAGGDRLARQAADSLLVDEPWNLDGPARDAWWEAAEKVERLREELRLYKAMPAGLAAAVRG